MPLQSKNNRSDTEPISSRELIDSGENAVAFYEKLCFAGSAVGTEVGGSD